MPFAFGKQYGTDVQSPTRTMGAAYNRDRLSAPLVKTGGGGNGDTGLESSGGGGGGNGTPLGCPKCVSWVWIPLGAVGVMSTLTWLLARK